MAADQLNTPPEDVIDVVVIPVGTEHVAARVVKLAEEVHDDVPPLQTVCTCHT